MNPLDTLDDRQLQGFFRRSKTEMSCMDKPQSFLKQLRDHKLILEEKYKVRKKVIQDPTAMTMGRNTFEFCAQMYWLSEIPYFWVTNINK